MAKKKQEMTSEELLAEALVREEDWPHGVPGNWVWVRLDKVLLNLTDGSHFSPKTVEKGYPYITVRDLTNGTIDFDNCKMISKDDYDTLSRNNCQPFEGDVLFSKDGTVGKVALIDFNRKFVVLSSLAILKPNINIVISEYIEKVLTSPQVLSQAINSKTGTAIKRLVLKNLKNILVPLPPLAEQQRIVDRIESLFDQLDQAKELIQEALDSFENRKAAILHQAFTGELTKKWRAGRGVGVESWEEKNFSEICSIVRGGSPRPAGDPLYYDGDIPFLKVADITHSEDMYIKSFKYSIKEAGLKKTRLVEPDTLLLTNSGATLGVPGITSFKTTFNDGIAAFLGLDKGSLKFFYYFWTSKTKELRGINKGAAQPNLNTEIIGNVEISLPSVPEQHEIANILDDLFAKEQNAKDLCDLIDQIEAIKKTILGKAFRGELGTNEAGEESAVQLLKKILYKN